MKKILLTILIVASSFKLSAQLDQFIGEIRITTFNFPPKGWAFCNGQILPISQNTALFSLLGTSYGGDGKSTFALPNLQGQIVIGPGQGSGLSDHYLGETGGSETVTLLVSEMPAHIHGFTFTPFNFMSYNGVGTLDKPANGVPANATGSYATTTNNNLKTENGIYIYPAGGSQPHNNMQPYLVMNYIIALQGIFPPRQ